MTSRDFCFWLQGMFELGQPTALNEATTAAIKAHLALVFVHEIDPSMGGPEHQAKLNAAHNGMTAEQVAELRERLEKVERRPPVVHHHDAGPMVMRC